jgi:CelD/BcsL family acetyltransferase involved in cellulose biosynthesis
VKQVQQLTLEDDPLAAPAARAWERLADELQAPPFLRPGWMAAWTRAFGRDPLRALWLTRGSETVGVLPFLERRGVCRSPTNWHTPQFGVLAGDGASRRTLLEALLQRSPVRLDLGFLDGDDDAIIGCLELARRGGRRALQRTLQRSPYVSLENHDWASYRSSLPSKPRKEVERLRRRLEEAGTMRTEWVTEPASLERALHEGLELEASGWKRDQKTAILSRPDTTSFYTELAEWAQARRELVLAFLRIDNRPVAFDLCLEAAGAIYVLKGGFDPAYRRFGPGMVLTYESLRRAFEGPMTSYELLGHADPYKLVWTSEARERIRLQVFGRSPRARLNHVAWTHGRSAFTAAAARVSRRPAGRKQP